MHTHVRREFGKRRNTITLPHVPACSVLTRFLHFFCGRVCLHVPKMFLSSHSSPIRFSYARLLRAITSIFAHILRVDSEPANSNNFAILFTSFLFSVCVLPRHICSVLRPFAPPRFRRLPYSLHNTRTHIFCLLHRCPCALPHVLKFHEWHPLPLYTHCQLLPARVIMRTPK